VEGILEARLDKSVGHPYLGRLGKNPTNQKSDEDGEH
jgi:hypothetical protein